ncbi:MAG: UDP-N-acetylmuramoyl-L-alanyl-D-glutamate--2,6-diaminopimelate ligase [Oscillospiraceae bacterium]|jgi:UDP-N-acetylmuramoyl-L-alanyl-D-glutamate--2,6-diaminopimelate ligase|nr:UDP-N-acetylmuramoyl-L-alanyl-D-glutamate--2,6-diaminopimelate ligase [Oscillospiraceae bacterium]
MQLRELLQDFPLQSTLTGLGTEGYDAAEVTLITEDSRKVIPGCVFVCVEGKHFDGHTKAEEAIAAGAVLVVAQKETAATPQLLVEDTRSAYSYLCAAFFGKPADRLELIGITGTNGKTTTTKLLKEIFDSQGFKTGLIGTLVNMVGGKELPAEFTTPDPWNLQALFAEMVQAGCTHVFMEVSSQALAQGRVAGVQFAAAGFSNLTQDHLDYHGTVEAYAQAKSQLFKQASIAVTNLDDAHGLSILKGSPARALTYSLSDNDADYTAKNICLKPTGVRYELVSKNLIERINYAVPGSFSVYNSMLAAVLAIECGISAESAAEAIAASSGVKGRMELVPVPPEKGYTVIIDYAHTPDGLENVLQALTKDKEGRLICVFGCGGDRDKGKRPLMGEISSRLADITVVTSDNPRTEDPDAIIADILTGVKAASKHFVEPDRIAAVRLALSLAKPGDTVLLAGKGQETYQILSTGKIHLDEREIAADYFSESGKNQ